MRLSGGVCFSVGRRCFMVDGGARWASRKFVSPSVRLNLFSGVFRVGHKKRDHLSMISLLLN